MRSKRKSSETIEGGERAMRTGLRRIDTRKRVTRWLLGGGLCSRRAPWPSLSLGLGEDLRSKAKSRIPLPPTKHDFATATATTNIAPLGVPPGFRSDPETRGRALSFRQLNTSRAHPSAAASRRRTTGHLATSTSSLARREGRQYAQKCASSCLCSAMAGWQG